MPLAKSDGKHNAGGSKCAGEVCNRWNEKYWKYTFAAIGYKWFSPVLIITFLIV